MGSESHALITATSQLPEKSVTKPLNEAGGKGRNPLTEQALGGLIPRSFGLTKPAGARQTDAPRPKRSPVGARLTGDPTREKNEKAR